MSTSLIPPPPSDRHGETHSDFDYAAAEGLAETETPERKWREWMMVGVGLTALLAMIAVILGVVSIGQDSKTSEPSMAAASSPAAASSAGAATAPAPTLAQAKGIRYERFHAVDPTLPAVPAGAVKEFTVSVIQHEVQVAADLAPVQAWTYTVNGVAYRGTAASPPMVVNQGDRVQITFVNGVGKDSGVDMAHSIDVHAAQIAPNLNYIDVAPGQKKVITFTAKYAGVFMYHCATQPVLMHTGAGMTGMLVVKPRQMPAAAKELWLVQNEYYIGQPGGLADETKMKAGRPDVIAFNGYANQYRFAPISVPAGKTVRLYVLNAGPSKWSAFHVIGTLFDTVDEEGVISHGAQTISLAPSQGAWVDVTLPQQGNYSIVTHSFADMTKGAAGVLHTPGAPAVTVTGAAPTGGSSAPVSPRTSSTASASTISAPAGTTGVGMGDMWLRASSTSAKAGTIKLAVKNSGQMDHWFAIMRRPVALHGGMLDNSAVLAKSKQLGPGQSELVTAHLAAGTYEFVCLMPGHYSAGQHQTFTVTG